jgi:DNA replication and repair protein RecF
VRFLKKAISMIIQLLEVCQFRNLHYVRVEPSSKLNLIYGDNGSGKTSFLEAIHYLGLGRSFRTSFSDCIVENKHDKLSIFANISDRQVGVEKLVSGSTRFRMSGKDLNSVAELARILPIQLINTDIYELLNNGPKYRREFIDWGVFHVEHSFLALWKDLRRVLKQRNLAIKMRAPKNEIKLWDPLLVELTNKMTPIRTKYIEELKTVFFEILDELIPSDNFTLSYYSGWDEDKRFDSVLDEALEADIRLGYTQYGPHRADLDIRFSGTPVKDFLSRGQQKVFVYAMRLAQGLLLSKTMDKRCVYLIDDLPAELDEKKRKILSNFLMKLNSQVFITSIEPFSLDFFGIVNNECPIEVKMFHVEHGIIKEVEILEKSSIISCR